MQNTKLRSFNKSQSWSDSLLLRTFIEMNTLPDIPVSKIHAFWEWFMENEGVIRKFFEAEELVNKELLVEMINNRVLDFGLFTWEVGPGVDKPYYLLISPNGDKDLLGLSRSVVHAAPDLPQWEFYPAKPPREEPLTFKLYDSFMRVCEVDASAWEFSLMEAETEGIELVIKSPSMDHLDEETQFETADKVVVNLIGEAWAIEYIEDLVLVSAFGPEEAEKAFPIQQLRFRMEEFLF